MGGFALLGRKTTQLEESPRPIHIEPADLFKLVQSKEVPWPEVDDRDIEARSKADWIVKLLALAQILWFVIQIISRAIQGLDITTLELFTQGIVFCAIVLYAVWWEKPFDVQQPIVIQAEDTVPVVSRFVGGGLEMEIINANRNFPLWLWAACLIVCLGFGALHLVAWNFHFPTQAERWLWRVSSLGCIVLPTLMCLYSILRERDVKFTDKRVNNGFAVLYVLFRIYMFVEMFVGLRSVPASVYQTPEWSQYFPAFG
jgi:hypothetical protein